MSKSRKEIVEEMLQVAEQMRLDDIEENPDIVNEFFVCDACGEYKCLAGSIQYNEYRLCNDCVLLVETGFELGSLKNIEQFIDAMEDKRLEAECKYIKQNEKGLNN